MKRTLFIALFSLVSYLAPHTTAQVTVGVDANLPWEGFMNVFELPENGGAYVFGSTWGTADLVATFDSDSLTLSPNTIEDPSQDWYQNTTGMAADPLNPGGPGQRGNRFMDANMLVLDNTLIGQNVTFDFTVSSNTFTSAHTTTAFIREFNADFSSLLFESSVQITTPGNYSISLETDPVSTNNIQYGFSTKGENVWATDVAPFGSIVIDSTGTPPPVGIGTYSQDFQSVGLAGTDPTALASGSENNVQAGSDGKRGWATFVNVFEGNGNYRFGYGTNPAPNEDPAAGFSQVVAGQGAGGPSDQYLNAFSDYNCCSLGEPMQLGHGNGTDMVNANLFQDYVVAAEDVGRNLEFSFDIKLPGGDQAANALGASGSATAEMFIKTLDPGNFSETGRTDVDILTGIAGLNDATWTEHSLFFTITSDMVGDIFQFGIESTASDFDPTGVFLDNISLDDASGVDNADFNGDFIVDGTDFLTVQRGFGTGTTLAQGDANGSGNVNGADVTIFRNQYGTVTPNISSVPEPASAALVLVGMLCLGGSRRRS